MLEDRLLLISTRDLDCFSVLADRRQSVKYAGLPTKPLLLPQSKSTHQTNMTFQQARFDFNGFIPACSVPALLALMQGRSNLLLGMAAIVELVVVTGSASPFSKALSSNMTSRNSRFVSETAQPHSKRNNIAF